MRLVFNLMLALAILYMPWWAGAIILIAGCLVIERFYEAVIYGIVADALYSTAYGFHGFSYVGSAFAAAVLLVSSIIRKRVVW